MQVERGAKKLRVLIADDHKLFRQGLASLLERYPDISTVFQAADGVQMLEMTALHNPDVVLMDLKMPVMTGVQAMPILNKKHPDVGVIVISMHTDPVYIASLMKDGASGYLLKDADINEVVNAIKTVSAGRNYINELIGDALINTSRSAALTEGQAEFDIKLSEQEKNLLRLIAQEFTSTQIADKLCLSKRTIDAHRRILLKKIGAKNTAGLISYAVKHNIY